jgi:hypothetical protein
MDALLKESQKIRLLVSEDFYAHQKLFCRKCSKTIIFKKIDPGVVI